MSGFFLFRNHVLVDKYCDPYGLGAGHLYDIGQHGDVLVILSYMGKYRAYFWVGKKKRYWRAVDSRKYPDLMPQLRAALLLQT